MGTINCYEEDIFFIFNTRSVSAFGHIIPHIQAEKVPFSAWEIIVAYLKLGSSHVIPLGFDHILFIISPRVKNLAYRIGFFIWLGTWNGFCPIHKGDRITSKLFFRRTGIF